MTTKSTVVKGRCEGPNQRAPRFHLKNRSRSSRTPQEARSSRAAQEGIITTWKDTAGYAEEDPQHRDWDSNEAQGPQQHRPMDGVQGTPETTGLQWYQWGPLGLWAGSPPRSPRSPALYTGYSRASQAAMLFLIVVMTVGMVLTMGSPGTAYNLAVNDLGRLGLVCAS